VLYSASHLRSPERVICGVPQARLLQPWLTQAWWWLPATFLTGKHVNRRTMLRGLGSAIALPLLDAMCPVLAAPSKLRKNLPRRIAVVYVPNGIVMNQWKPAETGAGFQFTRILKPLEPFRQDITMLSGLANQAANRAKGGGHAKATGSFLFRCSA
jgi:hypothetical protein